VQRYLKNLAEDFILLFKEIEKKWYSQSPPPHKEVADELVRRLEMDGYVFRDGELHQAEADPLDVEAETGLLESLHTKLGLSDHQTTFTFLKLSEEHYIAGRWSDCISNSRKFFEAILQQVAVRFGSKCNEKLDEKSLERPVSVREYLENKNLVEKKEREAIDKIYGLLSHTGSHPYMAEKDQARLLRQISLTTTQFVMLRLEGALQK
jgi:hypothetical protein